MNKAVPLRPIDRTYKSAIEILHSRRRLRRPSTEPGGLPSFSRVPEAKGKPDLKGTPSLVGMKQWLQDIGHSTDDIDTLNIIHVAGTKGKGSTCAFLESFLRAFGKRTGFPRKTGLYTSPHLIYPEERIRINFQPITRDLFTKYFFEVWDALSRGANESRTLPRYLQLLLLVSFHAFIREGVQAAVFETHHGGEYDATNVIEHPVATVITTLGMDHVKQLGPTIENIAWHKSGIFKQGSAAFSSPQEASAAEVLRSRASDKQISLEFVENDASLPQDALPLKPSVQRTNASVALAAVRRFVDEKAPKDIATLSPSDVSQGVSQFAWPGRFQLLAEGPFKWFLDSAHNEMSISKAAEWFIKSIQGQSKPSPNILIFSQISDERDGTLVLERLATILRDANIHTAIFTQYDPKQNFDFGIGKDRNCLATRPEGELQSKVFGEIWKRIHPESHILYEPSAQKAMESARKVGEEAGGMQTLVTGSQHLVGGALHHLDYFGPVGDVAET